MVAAAAKLFEKEVVDIVSDGDYHGHVAASVFAPPMVRWASQLIWQVAKECQASPREIEGAYLCGDTALPNSVLGDLETARLIE
jgi:hypothetical protein